MCWTGPIISILLPSMTWGITSIAINESLTVFSSVTGKKFILGLHLFSIM